MTDWETTARNLPRGLPTTEVIGRGELHELARHIAEYNRIISSDHHEGVVIQHINLNTRAHIVQIHKKYMLAVGFRDAYGFWMRSPNALITDIGIRMAYQLIIPTLHPRLQHPAVGSSHFRHNFRVNGLQYNSYSHYHEGWTCAIEYITWLMAIYHYRPDQH